MTLGSTVCCDGGGNDWTIHGPQLWCCVVFACLCVSEEEQCQIVLLGLIILGLLLHLQTITAQ